MNAESYERVSQSLSVLFLCTGNSCRSQMAEGLCRHLHGGALRVSSAGIEKHGLNPLAVKVMAEMGIDISGQHSKTLDDLEAESFSHVITVCGHAHETCPVFPGDALVIHQGFDDPPALARTATTDEEALVHYRRVRDEIHQYVLELPNLLAGLNQAQVSLNAIRTEGSAASINALVEQGRQARQGADLHLALSIAQDLIRVTSREVFQDWRPTAVNLAAQVQRDLGNVERAIEHYTELCTLCEQDGDQRGLAHAIRHLSEVHCQQGRHQLAANGFELALTIYRADPDTQALELANTLRGMALSHSQLEDSSRAMDLWLETSQIYASLGLAQGVEECEQWMARLDKLER